LAPALFAVGLGAAACDRKHEAAEAPVPRPVRTMTVEKQTAGDPISLTGTIQAVNEVAIAFRINGQLVERKVNVGDRVEPGQVLARLDSQNEENALHSAEAAVTAAEGQLLQARNTFARQDTLMKSGFTTRANLDQAQQALQTAQAALDDAHAQLRIASDRVGFTELRADAAGSVTARGAEPGEVVQAGQMIVTLARKEGRDAVFDVPAQLLRSLPADPVVQVSPVDNPGLKVAGHVREVAPQADPVTRTFQVKVGLVDPPPTFLLGSTVRGEVTTEAAPHFAVAASALTKSGGRPAVWVVDPASLTVSLRPVETTTFGPSSVAISDGIAAGDIVVTAGVQALHPGQKVRLLEAAR
jgi:RND family efflux transporter MFP subunit